MYWSARKNETVNLIHKLKHTDTLLEEAIKHVNMAHAIELCGEVDYWLGKVLYAEGHNDQAKIAFFSSYNSFNNEIKISKITKNSLEFLLEFGASLITDDEDTHTQGIGITALIDLEGYLHEGLGKQTILKTKIQTANILTDYFFLKDINSAEECAKLAYNSAIEYIPYDGGNYLIIAVCNLASVFEQSNRFDDAINFLTQAISCKDDFRFYGKRAQNYSKKRMFSDAKSDFNKSLDLAPTPKHKDILEDLNNAEQLSEILVSYYNFGEITGDYSAQYDAAYYAQAVFAYLGNITHDPVHLGRAKMFAIDMDRLSDYAPKEDLPNTPIQIESVPPFKPLTSLNVSQPQPASIQTQTSSYNPPQQKPNQVNTSSSQAYITQSRPLPPPRYTPVSKPSPPPKYGCGPTSIVSRNIPIFRNYAMSKGSAGFRTNKRN